jgi:hypothetical protein
MAKPKIRRKTTHQKTRREFFQSAGRGTVAVGGVLLFGFGGTLASGCGSDDSSPAPGGGTGPGGARTGGAGGGGGGNTYGASGNSSTGGIFA